MHVVAWFDWLTSDRGLMAVLGQNWSLGLLIIAGLIFVETGLVLMPFLPGDTLLFAAGAFLAVTGRSPPILIATASLAAIAGDAANYSIGRSAIGQQIVRRRWVKPRHMEQAERWFDRFGGSTVMIVRFVPIVRTIAPFMAGLAGMRAKRFFSFNIVGGVAWCTLLVEGGFWLGHVDWLRNRLTSQCPAQAVRPGDGMNSCKTRDDVFFTSLQCPRHSRRPMVGRPHRSEPPCVEVPP